MIERKVTRTTAFRLMRLAGTTEDSLTAWTLPTGARLYMRGGGGGRVDYFVRSYTDDGADVVGALALVGAKGRPVPMVSKN